VLSVFKPVERHVQAEGGRKRPGCRIQASSTDPSGLLPEFFGNDLAVFHFGKPQDQEIVEQDDRDHRQQRADREAVVEARRIRSCALSGV
jgi:hypothetical protein